MSESLNGGGNTNTRGSESLKFGFKSNPTGDCVSKDVMREIADRLIADLGGDESSGDIVRSTAPPSDRSKLWLPIDSQGRPIGGVRTYDFSTQTWVDQAGTEVPVSLGSPFVEHFFTNTIASDTDKAYSLDQFQANNLEYSLVVTPLFDVDEPRTDPDLQPIAKQSFYYWMEKSSQSAVVHFRGIPQNGGSFDITFRQKI